MSSPGLARYSRPMIIALLLVTVIAGIRTAGPAVAGRGPWRPDALAIGIGLQAALVALQVVLAVRARRRPAAGHLARRLRTAVRYLTTFAMIVIAVVAAVNLTGVRGGSKLLRALSARAKPAARRPSRLIRPLAPADGRYILYAAIALILLAAFAACVLVIRRMRALWPAGYPADIADDSVELRKAVESGRAALHGVDDARAAIIACYVAMEGSLAGAGAARAVAETPDELLSRAVTAGLLHGPAAAALTALFYEARFSSHPLADAAKHDARQALDAISAELHAIPAEAGGAHGSPQAGPAIRPVTG